MHHNLRTRASLALCPLIWNTAFYEEKCRIDWQCYQLQHLAYAWPLHILATHMFPQVIVISFDAMQTEGHHSQAARNGWSSSGSQNGSMRKPMHSGPESIGAVDKRMVSLYAGVGIVRGVWTCFWMAGELFSLMSACKIRIYTHFCRAHTV